MGSLLASKVATKYEYYGFLRYILVTLDIWRRSFMKRESSSRTVCENICLIGASCDHIEKRSAHVSGVRPLVNYSYDIYDADLA